MATSAGALIRAIRFLAVAAATARLIFQLRTATAQFRNVPCIYADSLNAR